MCTISKNVEKLKANTQNCFVIYKRKSHREAKIKCKLILSGSQHVKSFLCLNIQCLFA